ncbi:ASCH domain-containing protein [Parvularcula lutaonensis]|uniref:ASCH domain-containing protein n=1 Tax=Parvularcula lutaonensis TaxID=491923 RepID=A0ABV7MCS6_9PROT|nr:ASCH domain-containing protein [Parvularcula lutaonensis]GGY50809.1 RNA-binding protein [Parvularcula lutaonensis]
MNDSVRALWAVYRSKDPAAPGEPPAVLHFCDNEKDADICARLVVEGRKRATACSLAELAITGDPVPKPGDLAVVTDWAGEAQCVIRTRSVQIRRFDDVDETFAREEGEGDLTLSWWREAHEAYYRRVLEGSEHSFSGDLEIACERFEVVLKA